MAPALARELATQLESILFPLMLMIAAQFRILGVLTNPVWTRISRARRRLSVLLAHLAAGRAPRLRAPRPRPPRPAAIPAEDRRTPPPRTPLGPTGKLFLVKRLGYHAAGFGSQLQHLLHRPGMAETLAASHGALRTLRPICRILGVDLPVLLRLPSPPPRPARLKPAKPAHAKPEPVRHRHSIYPQRKPRDPWIIPPKSKMRQP